MLPKRKPLRLKGYDYSQCGAYYITICTYNREQLFGDIVGATLCGRPNNPDIMIAKWLSEIENKYSDTLVDKKIIMPDHIHFILVIECDHQRARLTQIIDWFKTMTTNEYIKGVKSGLYPRFDKHIWQRDYYEHIIRNDEDLNEIREYIEGNPIKWQILHS